MWQSEMFLQNFGEISLALINWKLQSSFSSFAVSAGPHKQCLLFLLDSS